MNNSSDSTVTDMKMEAVTLAKRTFGSVREWRQRCKSKKDPRERNRMVLSQICKMHPGFRRIIGS